MCGLVIYSAVWSVLGRFGDFYFIYYFFFENSTDRHRRLDLEGITSCLAETALNLIIE